ncbi:uncharacterized protein LOC124287211 [Haliotis rubra]|uniref:uncharacterized protein LOC124287211 n=1 Tax=Haliotis rubra TaxID=36100 RepID=UPI001EE512AE|nr:uncharacterized protein LOC124287211 [Haliotis rubra]
MSTYGSSTPTSTFLTSNSDNSRPDIQNKQIVCIKYVYIAIGGGGAFIIVCILGVVCLKKRRHRQGHSVKEDRPVIENGNLNTAFQHDSIDDDIMVENDVYERSADVISPATQDPGKADDRQVEGYAVKEGPPDIWNGNSNATLQHDSSDDDIMVENHLYERSSDVISQATRDLGNTDGVTDGVSRLNKVQEKTTQPDPVPVTAIPDSGDARPI